MSKKIRYTFEVENIGSEIYVKVPEEILKKLDWCEEDVLKWEIIDEVTLTVTRED